MCQAVQGPLPHCPGASSRFPTVTARILTTSRGLRRCGRAAATAKTTRQWPTGSAPLRIHRCAHSAQLIRAQHSAESPLLTGKLSEPASLPRPFSPPRHAASAAKGPACESADGTGGMDGSGVGLEPVCTVLCNAPTVMRPCGVAWAPEQTLLCKATANTRL